MYYWCGVQGSFDTRAQFSCVGLCVRLYNASSIVLFDLWASRSSPEVPYPSISPLSLATRAGQHRGAPTSSSGHHEIHTAQIQMAEITFEELWYTTGGFLKTACVLSDLRRCPDADSSACGGGSGSWSFQDFWHICLYVFGQKSTVRLFEKKSAIHHTEISRTAVVAQQTICPAVPPTCAAPGPRHWVWV